MKIFLLLLLVPFTINAQTSSTGRQLVSLIINYPPDRVDSGEYYLVADKLNSVTIKEGQTFIVQSTWRKEGDSVVTIGAGTVKEIKDFVGLRMKLYPGKTVAEGDMALLLVPLEKPALDTLFFKMARLAIGFTSIGDSSFYERNLLLSKSTAYPTQDLLNAMAKDIRFTGEAMLAQTDAHDQLIVSGSYKGQKLFEMMKKATAADVREFIRYVYVRPDKYKARNWRVSETFATWVVNGAPKAL